MKWNNYYEQYRRFFPSNPSRILEIGVKDGDGLRWLKKEYPKAELVGFDLHISQAALPIWQNGEEWKIYQGNQTDMSGIAWESFDIIIDDGGHRPYQQAASFKQMWPFLNEGGVYAIEDLHMGQKLHYRLYGKLFGIRPLLHKLVDQMNSWHGPEATSVKSPLAVIYTPQLVMVQKGSVEMRVE